MVEHSTSFGQAVGVYSASRPSYPHQAVPWLVGDAGNVIDVGAGTGKLTKVVRDLGRTVAAVDPDPRMLEQLSRDVPGVHRRITTAARLVRRRRRAGTGVALGRYGGRVTRMRTGPSTRRCPGLVWNVRDERVPWVASLTAVMHGGKAETMIAAGGVSFGPPFAALEQRSWEWTRPVRPEQIVDLAASRSYLITLPAADRAAVLAYVRHLLATDPDTAGQDELHLPYVPTAFRTTRP